MKRRMTKDALRSDPVTQALNFMIQSTTPPPLQDNKVSGQIRLNVENQRLVRLLRFILEDAGRGGTVTIWHVRDLLSGECYRLKQRSIGREFNEMEALAWVSR